MKESDIMRSIQLELSKNPGIRLFRNNVGVLRDENGTPVRYGLCTGSSDLIGWTAVTITPSMVGRKLAIFTAQEVKTEAGRVTDEQTAFLSCVKKAGGIAGVVRSVDDALEMVDISIGDAE